MLSLFVVSVDMHFFVFNRNVEYQSNFEQSTIQISNFILIAGLRPRQGVWMEHDCAQFQKLTVNKTFMGQFKHIQMQNDIYTAELVLLSSNNVNLSEKLVQEGRANYIWLNNDLFFLILSQKNIDCYSCRAFEFKFNGPVRFFKMKNTKNLILIFKWAISLIDLVKFSFTFLFIAMQYRTYFKKWIETKCSFKSIKLLRITKKKNL